MPDSPAPRRRGAGDVACWRRPTSGVAGTRQHSPVRSRPQVAGAGRQGARSRVAWAAWGSAAGPASLREGGRRPGVHSPREVRAAPHAHAGGPTAGSVASLVGRRDRALPGAWDRQTQSAHTVAVVQVSAAAACSACARLGARRAQQPESRPVRAANTAWLTPLRANTTAGASADASLSVQPATMAPVAAAHDAAGRIIMCNNVRLCAPLAPMAPAAAQAGVEPVPTLAVGAL